ncbi:MAG TPA: heavy metal-binding domain-containing protein, partial [bacterium]
MKNRRLPIPLIVITIVVVGIILAFFMLHHGGEGAEGKQLYTCPMHPQIIKDRPGDCPICGMKLVPLKKDEPVKDKRKTMYRSSMNPNEISDRPGKDSMGMEMIPFESEEEKIDTPPGLAPVTIPREKRELIGLAFSPVRRMRIFKETRTSARIVPDETRLFQVTIKVDGWVERLYVNQTGQYVRKGDP